MADQAGKTARRQVKHAADPERETPFSRENAKSEVAEVARVKEKKLETPMNEHQSSPPAQLATHRTADLMRQVILAATPAALISTWYFGYGVVLNLLVAICFAYALEASALYATTANQTSSG